MNKDIYLLIIVVMCLVHENISWLILSFDEHFWAENTDQMIISVALVTRNWLVGSNYWENIKFLKRTSFWEGEALKFLINSDMVRIELSSCYKDAKFFIVAWMSERKKLSFTYYVSTSSNGLVCFVIWLINRIFNNLSYFIFESSEKSCKCMNEIFATHVINWSFQVGY